MGRTKTGHAKLSPETSGRFNFRILKDYILEAIGTGFFHHFLLEFVIESTLLHRMLQTVGKTCDLTGQRQCRDFQFHERATKLCLLPVTLNCESGNKIVQMLYKWRRWKAKIPLLELLLFNLQSNDTSWKLDNFFVVVKYFIVHIVRRVLCWNIALRTHTRMCVPEPVA